MRDYFVSKLEGSNSIIEPNMREIVPGIHSNYIRIGERCRDGIVLLIDQIYKNNALDEIYYKVRRNIGNVGLVLFKDGNTFFRNAAERHYDRLRGDRSLKHYTDEDMRQMILIRPEEGFLCGIRTWLQYYQPKSDRLDEGLVSYKFEPVHFDYSHIDSRDRFKPHNTDSKKMKIWTRKESTNKKLVLDSGYLKERK